VLAVEQRKKLAKALQEGLEADSYSVQLAYTGEDGYYLAQAPSFDLMILDVMLPG
jgi:DNA-binding response OmpR family regulator